MKIVCIISALVVTVPLIFGADDMRINDIQKLLGVIEQSPQIPDVEKKGLSDMVRNGASLDDVPDLNKLAFDEAARENFFLKSEPVDDDSIRAINYSLLYAAAFRNRPKYALILYHCVDDWLKGSFMRNFYNCSSNGERALSRNVYIAYLKDYDRLKDIVSTEGLKNALSEQATNAIQVLISSSDVDDLFSEVTPGEARNRLAIAMVMSPTPEKFKKPLSDLYTGEFLGLGITFRLRRWLLDNLTESEYGALLESKLSQLKRQEQMILTGE